MDYDVGVTGLTSPPTSATKSTYRPAVSVRNNGIHDALASGVLRIYAAGLLIYTSEIYSPTIPPGETKDAQAVDYWTPDAQGDYMIIADVSSPLDQYEPNNHLNPTAIEVTGEPPVPPPPVEPHAAQHEDGGTDEVSIDGLKGRTFDAQEPLPHAADHQAGGTDVLNVSGLLGELAAAQTPKAHSNAYHSPPNATSAELADHIAANPVHSSALNLANRETSGIRAGVVVDLQLGDGSEVPLSGQDGNRLSLLREVVGFPATGRLWGFPWPTDHASMHDPGGRDPLAYANPLNIASGNGPLAPGIAPLVFLAQAFTAAQVKTTLGFSFHVVGSLVIAAGGGQSLTFRLMYTPGGGAPVQLLSGSQALSAPASYDFIITGFVAANTMLNWQSGGDFLTKNIALPSGDTHVIMQQGLLVPVQLANGLLQLDLTPVGWAPTSAGNISNSSLVGMA